MTAEKMVQTITAICMRCSTCDACPLNGASRGVCSLAEIDWDEVLRVVHATRP